MQCPLATVKLCLHNGEDFVSRWAPKERTAPSLLPRHSWCSAALGPPPKFSGIRTDCAGCFWRETHKAEPCGLRKDFEASPGDCPCQPSSRHMGDCGEKPRSKPPAQVTRPPACHVLSAGSPSGGLQHSLANYMSSVLCLPAEGQGTFLSAISSHRGVNRMCCRQYSHLGV